MDKLTWDVDDDLEAYLAKEFLQMHKVGLLYANWKGNWAYFSAVQYLIYYSVLLYFIFTYFYTAFLSIGDIALFSQSLHFGILTAIALIVSINCAVMRTTLITMVKIEKNGMCEYEKGAYYEEIKAEMTKERNILFVFFPLYYGCCALIAVAVAPMLDSYFVQEENIMPHPGLSKRLPVTIWTPFSVDEDEVSYWIMNILLGMSLIFSALIVGSGVGGCAIYLLNICLQLKLLLNSLNTINIRAENLLADECKGGTNLIRLNKHSYDHKYVNSCISENVKHHQVILKFFRIFASVISFPLFVPLVAGAIIVATAVVHSLSDDKRIGAKLTSVSLVGGEILNLLMYCVFGERIKELSENLREAVYSTEWYNIDKKFKNSVGIIQEKTLVPMNLKCLHLINLDMHTFATIMNSAYSYFNLVYALK